MRRRAPRLELTRTWRRSDDHPHASGGSSVKADAGCDGASPALTPSRPDADFLPSDRRPGLPPDQGPQNRHPAASTSRVPLRRKRPAGTQGSGDIGEPSAVTERARSIGDRALSEIDAPGPHLTPACGGRLRQPRTDHPRSRRQLGAFDPRSPITEAGSTTVSGSRAGLAARPAPLYLSVACRC
jgi:hypothetical protein